MLRSIAVAPLFALAVGCGAPRDYGQSIRVIDVTREQVIVLRNSRPGTVHALAIRVSTKIEGKASVSLLLNEKPYETEEIEGAEVVVLAGGDWYSDTAVLIYRPVSARSGSVLIEYEFSTI